MKKKTSKFNPITITDYNKKTGKFSIDVICEKCGKPITHSNEYGMFCDNNCFLGKSKKAKKDITNLLKLNGFLD